MSQSPKGKPKLKQAGPLSPDLFPKTRSFVWKKNELALLDQRELPHVTRWRSCATWMDVAAGIKEMVVRGAPAIGCTAAYGLALAAKANRNKSILDFRAALDIAASGLLAARPTAVNLRWALERLTPLWAESTESPAKVAEHIAEDAARIEIEDRACNIAMGTAGAALVPEQATLMTICNTGSLATAGLGTAFGVIWTAFHQGKVKKVLVSETRPYLQGARLTAWELQQEGIPFELITDNMAAHIMKTEPVHGIFVGADRIAANGDTANKIGTYGLAVLAAHHGVPFYVAAPLSTIDLRTPDGTHIPIEERSSDEVTSIAGKRITPENIKARHPAFDVTPAMLISGIITEEGIARRPFSQGLPGLFAKGKGISGSRNLIKDEKAPVSRAFPRLTII